MLATTFVLGLQLQFKVKHMHAYISRHRLFLLTKLAKLAKLWVQTVIAVVTQTNPNTLLVLLGVYTFHRRVPRFKVLAEDLGDWFLGQVLRLEQT